MSCVHKNASSRSLPFPHLTKEDYLLYLGEWTSRPQVNRLISNLWHFRLAFSSQVHDHTRFSLPTVYMYGSVCISRLKIIAEKFVIRIEEHERVIDIPRWLTCGLTAILLFFNDGWSNVACSIRSYRHSFPGSYPIRHNPLTSKFHYFSQFLVVSLNSWELLDWPLCWIGIKGGR